MNRDPIHGMRRAGIFLLALLLFNFPWLHLFNHPVLALGVPLAVLYLFGAWLLIVLLTLIVSRSRSEPPGSNHRS